MKVVLPKENQIFSFDRAQVFPLNGCYVLLFDDLSKILSRTPSNHSRSRDPGRVNVKTRVKFLYVDESDFNTVCRSRVLPLFELISFEKYYNKV